MMMAYGDFLPETEEPQIGEAATLVDGSRFRAWENGIAAEMARGTPVEELETWFARPPLSDLIRQDLEGYQGSLRNIQIEPLPDALKELINALDQKVKFATHHYNKAGTEQTRTNPADWRCYLVTATASSTVQETVDDIYTVVWFEAVPDEEDFSRIADVRRYVRETVATKAAFEQLVARSRGIGTILLRDAASRAIPTGMTGQSMARMNGPERRFNS